MLTLIDALPSLFTDREFVGTLSTRPLSLLSVSVSPAEQLVKLMPWEPSGALP